VASVGCAVLIRGETGTGKEVIARAIHDASDRRRQRFVAINCAAIPAPLIESELFGYERGAFTGALTHRIGRFQSADGGTLFLDEIGELPIELQPKLLRAIQEKEFDRLGGRKRLESMCG
jgi:formate hydrogenlyase transcriptional activator